MQAHAMASGPRHRHGYTLTRGLRDRAAAGMLGMQDRFQEAHPHRPRRLAAYTSPVT